MKLYKYAGFERRDILANQSIRFTQPGQLNDPFEARPHIKAISISPNSQAVVEDLFSGSNLEVHYQSLPDSKKIDRWSTFDSFRDWVQMNRGYAEELVRQNNTFSGPGYTQQEFQARVLNFFDERFGVLCLSEDPTCFTMWSHYADSHRGFVIEFDSENSFFHQEEAEYGDVLGKVMEVGYSDVRPDVFWERPPDLGVNEYEQYIVDNFLLTKSKVWKTEAEWRMILPLRDAERKIKQESGEIYLYDFPTDAVTGVIFGLRMSKQNRQKIKEILEPYQPVGLREAVLHDRAYELSIIGTDLN
jgi:hypothetical protein